MSLKNQIEEKLNKALKEKDKNIYPTLRLIVSAIKDTEIANRTKEKKEISDSDIMSILKKMIKQRNESCEVYKKAGRSELLEIETKEMEVINTFLPKQISDEKRLGTCYIAIGDNTALGGRSSVGIHIPGVLKSPSVWLDDTQILDDGKFILEL